ncbi:MAG: OmpA family protein [Paludibacteraceae bacterium]|nr:OmpA family protein [Paludibacteraceae bacterium]
MKNVRKHIMVALLAAITMSAGAQQVNTLYFLENAPMRHTINPAFQPVSQGYINFSPLGWTSMGFGNNTFTVSDVLLVDRDPNSSTYGQTITIMHPNASAQRQQFVGRIPSMTLTGGDATFGLINMGFRIKENGFLMIGINERLEANTTLPKPLMSTILGGTLDFTNQNFNLGGLGAFSQAYTEISGGYSYRINDQWTVGGKAKFLMGQMYAGFNGKQLSMYTSPDEIQLKGNMDLDVAGPVNFEYLNSKVAGQSVQEIIDNFNQGTFSPDSLLDYKNVAKMLTPTGFGLAFDLGFTYKPIEQLQLSVAITDLGFLYWTKTNRFNCSMDTTFAGVGNIDYSDPAYQDEKGNFDFQKVSDKAIKDLEGLLNGVKVDKGTVNKGFAKMTSARLNVGLDANFWDNRVGVGVVSATRLYNARLYEEVTLGVAFRPVNWFNIAASYSLLNNGKYSNIGAGLGFMPYDGINLTLALDYIPTSYAALPNNDASAPKQYFLPDRAKMVNVALGFSIVWGSNRKDKDKDGVWDKIDMCPNTPRGVAVDSVGCPLDEDHDGVPDYLDRCPGTPEAAIGYVDSVGCPLDTDGDGVPDYLDECPNTPEAAYGQIDSVGCPLDTDGDGVPDYLDECPGTPEAAWGKVDAKGCPLDTDGDGVPDYIDQCPGTPVEAYGQVDTLGCPIDTDGDGVPDYKDECPGTPQAAWGHVDARGCELDTDGDGVPDYLDECPTVPGLKENKGCPELKREVRNLLKKAMQGIEFETGKATIKKKSYPLLNQIAKVFIENTNYNIEVQGHTDSTGKYEINKELSEKRANAVRDYLIEQGVDFQRLTAVGYGPDVPIADNKTKAGRAKNRRVEFKITFEEISYESVMDHADPTPAVPAVSADSTAVVQ